MFDYQKTQINTLDQNTGVEVDTSDFEDLNPQQLNGRWVKLIPIQDIEPESNSFRSIWRTVERESNKGAWTYLPYPEFAFQVQLETALKSNFGFYHAQHYLIQVGHQFLGWIALLNIRQDDRVAEIGNIYFSDQMKQTTAATEAVYLLLQECFEQNFRKVEWRCDDLNEASVNAAVRLGFLYEGTLRQDRIVKDHNRNTACFSILDEEWIKLQQAFTDWLKQDNFNIERQQKIRLEEFMKLYPIIGRNDPENADQKKDAT